MGKAIISKDGRFEWDEEKDKMNQQKHGFSFAEILPVFDDPYFFEGYDIEHSENEDRYFGIGCINGVLFVLVFYTERNKRIRIFSARLADRRDKEAYDDNCRRFNAAENG
jgi:uncharacterized DUF497 family protein